MTPPQWFAPLPAGFARAAAVGEMRERFGPAGLAVPAVLLAEAEAQKQLGGPRGCVKMTYTELAYLTGSDPSTVREAVEFWTALGQLEADFFERAFTARWIEWDRWQGSPPARRLAAAEGLLRDVLANGPTSLGELEARAAESGVSSKTLERARGTLDVESFWDGRTAMVCLREASPPSPSSPPDKEK